jgi:hypothetical protein
VVLLYVSWVLFSRWQENRDYEQRAAQEKAEKQRQRDRDALQQFGGKELAIQGFYGNPKVIHPGEKVQLCYNVANAKTVKIEPGGPPVWPSYANCVDVSPTNTTTYTLTIQDAAGNTQTATQEINVVRSRRKPTPPIATAEPTACPWVARNAA